MIVTSTDLLAVTAIFPIIVRGHRYWPSTMKGIDQQAFRTFECTKNGSCQILSLWCDSSRGRTSDVDIRRAAASGNKTCKQARKSPEVLAHPSRGI